MDLPCHRFVLEQRLAQPLAELQALMQQGPVVFLDYETSCDSADLSKPPSHASLVAAHLREALGADGEGAAP